MALALDLPLSIAFPDARDPSRAPVLSRPPVRRVSVCVPARNEAARLPAFFAAIKVAVVRAVARGIACEVVVALDGCTDGSGRVVAAHDVVMPCPVRSVVLAPIGMSHAGRARKAGMESGLDMRGANRGGADMGDLAILTTDADTRVDPDWIVASVDALRETDLVAGYVEWDDETTCAELIRQESYFDALHRWRRTVDPVAYDADDPHHKHYGASLGIRASVYRALGGLPERPHNEDTALVRAARLQGYRVRQDRSVRVLTSTRIDGRAENGFADAITSVGAMQARGEALRVDCPDALTDSYHASARLRALFERAAEDAGSECGSSRFVDRGGCVGTDLLHAELEQAWASSSTADAFVSRVFEPAPPRPKISLDAAIARLDKLKRGTSCHC